MSNRQLCTVYWPRECLGERSGWLVGWNIRGFVACVCAVSHDPLVVATEACAEFSDKSGLTDSLWRQCGGPPQILGQWVNRLHASPDASPLASESELAEHQQAANLWITLECIASARAVRTRDFYCCGCRYTRVTAHLVLYDRPALTAYFAPAPISLDVVACRTESSAVAVAPEPASELAVMLKQVNASNDVAALVQHTEADCVVAPQRRSFLARTVLRPLIVLLMLVRLAAWPALRVLEWPLPASIGAGSLCRWSSAAEQLRVRFSSVCRAPLLYRLAVAERKGSDGARAYRAALWNMVFLAIIDTVLGVTAALWLYMHGPATMSFVHIGGLSSLSDARALSHQLMALMGWPPGFKLNPNLDHALGSLFLTLISLWNGFTTSLEPLNAWLFWALIAGGALGGLSTMLAMGSDIVAVATLHIFALYSIAARVYKTQLDVLSSLFKLFRGKKYNALRGRIDSCNYDLNQLMLGTILFTILFFLFPTTAVYYIFFALARLLVVFAKLGLGLGVCLLNHFPVYTLAIFFGHPERLPGGVQYEILSSAAFKRMVPGLARALVGQESDSTRESLGSPSARSMSSYFLLHNRRVPLGVVFFELRHIANIVSRSGLLTSLPSNFIWGLPIPEQPDLMVPQLPDGLPNIQEFWSFVSLLMK